MEPSEKAVSRRKEKKHFPIWIPVLLAVLAAAGVLLYVFWWPVPADEAYALTLETASVRLAIEDGRFGEEGLSFSLQPLSELLEARAKKSFAETKLLWSSSDPSVAEVDENGLVRAVGKGAAVITGSYGTLTVSCPVEVWYPVTGIALSETERLLQKNESFTLSFEQLPAQAEKPADLRLSSSAPEIVSVDESGLVKALAVGEAIITAEAGGFSADCRVRVASRMEAVVLEPHGLTMNVGETRQLEHAFLPEDTTDSREVSWTSSDPETVSVNENGLLTALLPGTARISLRCGDFSDVCDVEVFAPLTGIALDAELIRLEKDESAVLSVLYDPENTTDDRTVTFESSSPEHVSVEPDGTVTALEAGEALITARVGDFEAVCQVYVRVAMTGIEIDGLNQTLARGTQSQLTVSFYPADTNDEKTLSWTSDDPSVAYIDENGLVTAVGAGQTLVTASCGEFSSRLRITVIVPMTGVAIDRNSLSLQKGESAYLSARLLPEDTTEEKWISFSSSDTSVASVGSDGRVSAVGAGSCTVTAWHGSYSASCSVYVTAPLKGISLNKTDVTLLEGENTKFSVSYDPWDTTDSRGVSWTSSDSGVAAVGGDGTVLAISAGTCTVTAQVGSFTASAIVRVKAYVPVTSVTLSCTEYYFTQYGESFTLYATVSPDDATYPSVSWSSSDPSVASVNDSGVVRVSGNGSCVITATAGGVSASCQIGASLPEAPKVIVLDPGHGPWSGATAFGVQEKDLNLDTAYACKAYLEANYSNIVVYMTRYGDYGGYGYNPVIKEDIRNRAAWAAYVGADIVVCMHYNAADSGGTGSMVFYQTAAAVSARSYALGNAILQQIVKLGFANRGMRTSYYGENDAYGSFDEDYYSILRNSANYGIPAVLVEHCFMDSASDYAMLNTTLMGYADAVGIAQYLGLTPKE